MGTSSSRDLCSAGIYHPRSCRQASSSPRWLGGTSDHHSSTSDNHGSSGHDLCSACDYNPRSSSSDVFSTSSSCDLCSAGNYDPRSYNPRSSSSDIFSNSSSDLCSDGSDSHGGGSTSRRVTCYFPGQAAATLPRNTLANAAPKLIA